MPIALLVIAAALIATTVQFTSMFSGPPPWFRPVPTARREALRTGQCPTIAGASKSRAPARIGSAAATSNLPPSATPRDREADLAPAAQVQGLYEFPPRDPDSDIRGSFTVGLQNGDGWILVSTAPPPTFTSWHLRRLAGMLLTLAILSLLASACRGKDLATDPQARGGGDAEVAGRAAARQRTHRGERKPWSWPVQISSGEQGGIGSARIPTQPKG